MTRAFLIRPAFAAAFALSALATAPASAQRPVKVAPPTAPWRDSSVVAPLEGKTPPPSSVRPSRAPAASRAATKAVVAPITPAGPPVESMKPGRALSSVTDTPERVKLAPAVPPSPLSARSSDTPAPAVREAAPPAGASGRCRDGGYVSGGAPAEECATRGGAAVLFPAARVTPVPPRRTP